MKPAPFEYVAPTSVVEALGHLAEHGYDAKLLAGGQSLVPTMNFRLARPAVIVDLNRLGELSYIRRENGITTSGSEPEKGTTADLSNGGSELRIGAMTRQAEVEASDLVAELAPLVHEAMPYIAHPQIRNRGTIGGSLAHADPAAELPAVMTALGARFKVGRAGETSGAGAGETSGAGAGGRTRPSAAAGPTAAGGPRPRVGGGSVAERWVSADDFFLGFFTTALEPEEILLEVAVPALAPRTGWAFEEIARRHGDYALVGVAALIRLDGDSKCGEARLSFLSVGPGPVQASRACEALEGEELTDQAIGEAAWLAATEEIEPTGDIHATPGYRRQLAGVLAARALRRAAERARDGDM